MAANILNLHQAPSAIEAEQGLLGACILDAQAFDVASSLLDDDDFSEDAHRLIWEALKSNRGNGRVANFKLVTAALGSAGHQVLFDNMTVNQYVARLASEAATISEAPHFARAIKDVADVRRLIAVAGDIQVMCRDGLIADAESIASEAIVALDRIMQSHAKSSTPRVSIGVAAERALEQAREHKGKVRGISWGLESLDRLTLGLRPSHLYVIGGRPGMGKTMLALSAALAVARTGKGALFVSLEMSETELAERALSSEMERAGAQVSYQKLAAMDVPDAAMPALERAYERIREMPFEIEQQPGVTLGQIRARARQVKHLMERKGIKLGAIFVDHIGLIRGEGRKSRYDDTTDISNGLKTMAKEFGTPVVALAQLNRQVEGREDKRATLADLRDSGAIEQDADCVIFPFREAYYLNKQKDLTADDITRLGQVENIMEIAVAKQRNGPEGRLEAYCLPGCNVVRDLERAY